MEPSIIEAIFDRAQDGLLLVDQFARLRNYNDAAAAIIGPAVEDAETVDSLFEPHLRRYLAHTLNRGASHFETELPSGAYVDVRGSLIQESPPLVLFSLRDATALRHARAEREKLTATLAEKRRLETLGELVGGIAHDFNNLLAPILSNSEILADSLAGHESQPLSEDIRVAAKHAAALANKIRVLNRKTTENAPRAMLLRSLHECQQLAGRDEDFVVTWRINIDERLAVPMTESDFGSIIINLISNARDASNGKGSCTVQAQAIAQGDSNEALILVRDSGEGIPDAIRNRIFDPYFTTKARDRGTGLGLATVRALIEECGGTVSLSNEVDTCFVIRLPATLHEIKPVTRAPSASSLEGRNILVVDDDPLVLRSSSRILKRKGAHVVSESCALTAMNRIKEGEAFDIVLSDYLMPDMNGLELSLAICAHTPSLPVVVCSGQIWSDQDAEELRRSTRRILSKPISGPDLIAALSEVLEESP